MSSSPPSSTSLATVSNKMPHSPAAEKIKTAAKEPKYTYVTLDQLKPDEVVNVYAIVTSFKQPYKSRGTDYCSSLKITDQTNSNVGCSIFCEKLEDHPKIFQIGDIVRLHRFKPQLFKSYITLLTSFGFSVLTFDGKVGSEVVPRTSSKSYHFGPSDQKAVEELRAWAATQDLIPAKTSLSLSTVNPNTYFDLTCQLLAKAPFDSSCILLKVWDGTKCPHPRLNMLVDPSTLEGDCSLSDQRDLTANILVYDNHLEMAQRLKPGDYIRIYNVHALAGNNRLPLPTEAEADQQTHLVFHLHGGTSYGKGLQVLPSDSLDIQELKSTIDSLSSPDTRGTDHLSDSEPLIYHTPPESSDTTPAQCFTERTCRHNLEPQNLADVKENPSSQVFHVRVQLKSYQPQMLHQSLQLHCPKCKALQILPDDSTVAGLFSQALEESGPCHLGMTIAGSVDPLVAGRQNLTLHLPIHLQKKERVIKALAFLRGATLEEACLVAEFFSNLVPVQAAQGSMSLMDLTAPFLFRGKKRYYGCKQCSQVNIVEAPTEGVEVMDKESLSKVFGVQLLQYCLVMKLELQDRTGTLETVLWRDAESFFKVSAEDAAFSQEAQDQIQLAMEKLCLPGRSTAERPWLDMCIRANRIEENGQTQYCYQVCNTNITFCPPSSC